MKKFTDSFLKGKNSILKTVLSQEPKASDKCNHHHSHYKESTT